MLTVQLLCANVRVVPRERALPALVDKRATLTESELHPLQHFHCRDARCFKPADRAYVMSAIVRGLGSEATFDLYVQTQLPRVLATCKLRYSGLLLDIVRQNLEHVAGD